jgi:hypothetical protein
MFSCSKCGGVLGANGVCPNCGTAHQIPAPVQPVAPVQPQIQQPPPPPPPPTVQQGDFCAKCGTKLSQWKTCPAGCVTATASTGSFLDGLIGVEEGDAVLLLGGTTKIKMGFIFAGIAGLIALMFALPWYRVSVSLGFFDLSLSETVNGFKVVFDGDGADFLHLILFFHPALIAAFSILTVVMKDVMMTVLAKVKDKLYLILAGAYGFGILLMIIFLAAFSSKVPIDLAPSVGWVFALLLNLLGAGVCVLCYLQLQKKR